VGDLQENLLRTLVHEGKASRAAALRKQIRQAGYGEDVKALRLELLDIEDPGKAAQQRAWALARMMEDQRFGYSRHG
jgi:hypothetical protein